MSDELRKIELDDSQETLVAGGRLVTVSTRTGLKRCWSNEQPDVLYTFDNVQSIYAFECDHPEYSNNDPALIEALLSAGIIRPL